MKKLTGEERINKFFTVMINTVIDYGIVMGFWVRFMLYYIRGENP